MKKFLFCISFITLIIYTQDISMKMRTFSFNTLCRTLLLKKMELAGSTFDITPLSEVEFDQKLRLKLEEEATEVKNASSKEELMQEIADIYEVIDTLMSLHNFDKQTIIDIQTKKRLTRGGFERENFVTNAHHLDGSFGSEYCLGNPDRYPEIK